MSHCWSAISCETGASGVNRSGAWGLNNVFLNCPWFSIGFRFSLLSFHRCGELYSLIPILSTPSFFTKFSDCIISINQPRANTKPDQAIILETWFSAKMFSKYFHEINLQSRNLSRLRFVIFGIFAIKFPVFSVYLNDKWPCRGNFRPVSKIRHFEPS